MWGRSNLKSGLSAICLAAVCLLSGFTGLSACQAAVAEAILLPPVLPLTASAPARLLLKVGQRKQLFATIQLPDGRRAQDLVWRSLNPERVSVDASGVVKGLSPGSARVQVHSAALPANPLTLDLLIESLPPESLSFEEELVSEGQP